MSEPAETTLSTPPAAVQGHPDSLQVRPNRDFMHSMGRTLVSHFYTVAKTAAMFDFTNVITKEALRTILGTLGEIFAKESTVTLTMAADCLFVNETRLKIDFEGFTSFKYVIEAMRTRDIGTIRFRSHVDEEALEVFLRPFLAHGSGGPEARKEIETDLRAGGVDSIEVEEVRDLAEDEISTDVSDDYREVSINTYFKTIFVAKQFIENFRGSRVAVFRKAKRLVHSIVDLVAQDETTLLALTQIKNFDHYLFTHSANVCVLSVALGQALGLEKGLLANLGLAALMHDVGMTEIPRGILTRRDSLSKEERRIYEQHPTIGARAILRTQGINDAAIRCVLVAYEHHIREDGTGFPDSTEKIPRTLIGRIVGLVDFYDVITTPDDKAGPSFAPEEALRLMANEGRDVFDPGLVKMFVNTIGTYPLGTVVRLDTGEVGIVHRKGSHVTPQSRPLVKIVKDESGEAIEPRVVDLNEWDRTLNRFSRSIVETIAPSLYFEGAKDFTEFV